MGIKDFKKISIVGGPGTGKTTLSDNLSKQLNLPVYHIDGIHHLANWEIRDKEERDKIIADIINGEKWIVDGTYKNTLQKRFSKSDLIIFLNYSSFAKLKGILFRYLKNKGIEKKEIPGCKEKMEWKFIKFTLRWNREKRKYVFNTLYEFKDKKIIIFKNRRQLNNWYKKEFGKKIEVD